MTIVDFARLIRSAALALFGALVGSVFVILSGSLSAPVSYTHLDVYKRQE